MPRLRPLAALALALALIPAGALAQEPLATARPALPAAPAPAAGNVPAPGTVLDAIDADTLIAVMAEAGVPAGWVNTETGARVLFGALDRDTPFQVVLQNCAEPEAACSDIEFHSAFDGRRPGATLINEWNRDKTWGAYAFLTEEGAPGLRLQFTLEGGVTPVHLKTLVQAWGGALRQFLQHVGLDAPAAANGG